GQSPILVVVDPQRQQPRNGDVTVKQVLVIGAAGDVGRGVAGALAATGWQVLGAGRSAEKLRDLSDEVRRLTPDAQLTTLVGDLATETSTRGLADDARADQLDAVVTTIGAPWPARPLAQCTFDDIAEYFDRYLRLHFNAAKVFLPLLKSNAVYLAVGGGMADAVFPNLVPLSMTQAAQRSLIRGFAKESRGSGVHIRELMIASHVNGRSTRDVAEPDWLTDQEIGSRALEIVSDIDAFPGTIVTISPQNRVAP
uniref:SDR family oxidoreductase n=1 Tax=Mycobacterium avium TaxID=1764 RepID=UPI0012DA4048